MGDKVLPLDGFRLCGATPKSCLCISPTSSRRLKCDISSLTAIAIEGACTALNQLLNTCLGAEAIPMGG